MTRFALANHASAIGRMLAWHGRNFAKVVPRCEREALWRLQHLARQERKRPGTANFGSDIFRYIDGPSFYYQLEEIFVRGIYDFDADAPNPRIIDCGGNIGTSVRRFRRLYPEAEMTVLEADPEIAEVLEENLKLGGDGQTRLLKGAAWIANEKVRFEATGDDAGRISAKGSLTVTGYDIAELCNEPVDLLKLDIEGGEYEVLNRLIETSTLCGVKRLLTEMHDFGNGPNRFHDFMRRLTEAGFRYQLGDARSSDDLNPEPSASGFRAIPCKGNLALVYAWRPEEA